MKIWKEGNLRIGIKDSQEIQAMREGGKILGIILHELEQMVVPGITLLELDKKAAEMMANHHVKPSFLGYYGFPNVLCINVNDVVVHGIPDKTELHEGDIVTIDCGVIHKDFQTDSAIQKGVGKITPELTKFLNTAQKALDKAIETAKPGIRIRTISGVIQDIVEKNGYSVVRDLVGHGIGHKMHEDPPVPNFRDEAGPMLQTGMTIAIEPIICMGNRKVKTLRDGWTMVSADGSYATQVEHTIAITQKGAEILTKRPE
ncbi:MAG: type I methionyl aminopeptidase [Candidatus Gracilibacteria bacterium]|jgi:methionyl aminopeptidase